MGRKFSLEQLLVRLSVIPGLTFLQHWLREVRSVHTQFGQRTGDLQTYYNIAREGASDVRNVVSSPANLDPDIDAAGNNVCDESDANRAIGTPQDESRAHTDPRVDGFSQSYEDVFYDDGDF